MCALKAINRNLREFGLQTIRDATAYPQSLLESLLENLSQHSFQSGKVAGAYETWTTWNNIKVMSDMRSMRRHEKHETIFVYIIHFYVDILSVLYYVIRLLYVHLINIPFRGMLQRRKGTNNPKIIPPNVPYENCSHFWDIFWKCSKKCSKIYLTYVPI